MIKEYLPKVGIKLLKKSHVRILFPVSGPEEANCEWSGQEAQLHL